MKKIITLLLAAALSASMMISCGQEADDKGADTSAQTENQTTEFTISYPSYMQDEHGESLVLEEKPEKVICLSNSALQILVRCDIHPIASTKPNRFVDYPDWVKELPTISTGMRELDIESVISMEPDLLIMGGHLEDDYGPQLADAGIPVYFTSEGPSITYNEVKEEAIVLTRSFGSEEEAKKVESEFEAVEKKAADFKAATDSMILFGAPPSYQQTSMGYLGSILKLLSFPIISDTLIDPEERTAPLDLEKLVEINPPVIFAISPTCGSSDDIKKVYDEEIEKNPQIWESLDAVTNNKVIYLSNEYVTSKGIHIINSISNLIDMLEAQLG